MIDCGDGGCMSSALSALHQVAASNNLSAVNLEGVNIYELIQQLSQRKLDNAGEIVDDKLIRDLQVGEQQILNPLACLLLLFL